MPESKRVYNFAFETVSDGDGHKPKGCTTFVIVN